MPKYLLDTNICVFYLRGRFGIDKKCIEAGGLENCIISEITLAELKYGAELSGRVQENTQMLNEFAKRIGILPIFNSIDIFAKEKARLKNPGSLIDDFDLLIASSAVANNLILVTDNEKHFNRIEHIVIENWINR
jgi:tRNA(fMet)-specific endonuclease VapC